MAEQIFNFGLSPESQQLVKELVLQYRVNGNVQCDDGIRPELEALIRRCTVNRDYAVALGKYVASVCEGKDLVTPLRNENAFELLNETSRQGLDVLATEQLVLLAIDPVALGGLRGLVAHDRGNGTLSPFWSDTKQAVLDLSAEELGMPSGFVDVVSNLFEDRARQAALRKLRKMDNQ